MKIMKSNFTKGDHVVVFDNVEFEIYSETNTLISMIPLNDEPKDVFIPSVFPTGETIDSIGYRFCKDAYLSITIDDKISEIRNGAFERAHVKKVTWPSSCSIIPISCFNHSCVEELLNIEHVDEIMGRAFESSNIKNFKWPKNCKEIPQDCFSGSNLSSICGIEDVEDIGHHAFSASLLESFVWPSKCYSMPWACFENCSYLERIDNVQNISKISSFALASLSPSGMFDFSNSAVIEIMPYSFAGVSRDKVIFPYYMTPEMIESAFSLSE